MEQQAYLMNPKNGKEKVVVCVVNGFGGIDKFHFTTIPEAWLKVVVKNGTSPNADPMYPHKAANQHQVKDVVRGNTLWDEKFNRRA
jgi:hypothetical protein